MKTFIEFVKNRRSTRKFQAKEVEQEKIDTILKAALMAPSGKRTTPWHFIVVNEPELMRKLSEAREHGSQFLSGAPMAIVNLVDTTASTTAVEDASIAAIFIQLAAEDLGLGSCWVHIRERFRNESQTSEAYVRELLQIPDHFAVENIIALGYKNEEKKPFDLDSLHYEKISYNQF